jgi:DNA-binding MarR family transcriptional regulator
VPLLFVPLVGKTEAIPPLEKGGCLLKMIEPFHAEFLAPTKKFRRLSILLAIHDSPETSQHKMAEMAHLSSSMVNNYIKSLQEEDLITVSGDTNRTRRYHLTVFGRDMLISALLSYSSEIIRLYGVAKNELAKRLRSIYEEGVRSVALFGAAETAEVVLAAIKATRLAVAAVVDSDPSKQGKSFNGLTIMAPKDLRKHRMDAVVITSFGRQQEILEDVRKLVGAGVKVIKLSDL